MKKNLLFFVATLLVYATAMAQTPKLSQARLNRLSPIATQAAKQAPSKADLQQQTSTTRKAAATAAFRLKKDVNASKLKTLRKFTKTARKAAITEQPAGEQVWYVRSCEAAYPFWGYVFTTSVQGGVGNVVFGSDNKVYLRNVISQLMTDTWIEGTLDGDKITFDFPQDAMESEGEVYRFALCRTDEEGNVVSATDVTTLTLNYDAATRAITTPADSEFKSGDLMIGIVDADGIWAGYADWNINLDVLDAEPVVAPDDMTTIECALTAEGFDGTLVKVGVSGTDIYVQGIYPALPEAWVKGSVNPMTMTATIPNGTFLGADETTGYYQYLVSAQGEEVTDPDYGETYTEYTLLDSDIEFTFDLSTLTGTSTGTFLVNAGTDEVNYAAFYTNALIKKFTEVAATPAAPVINNNEEYDLSYYGQGYGFGYIDFNLNTLDEDGNFILGDKLSYALFARVNGEEVPLTFSKADYYKLDWAESESIPYGYSENWDFYATGSNHEFYYYTIGAEAYGLQAIYTGGGEERRSEITWVEMAGEGSELQPEAATPDYPDSAPDAEDNEITWGFYTGAEDVGMFGEAKAQNYDVAIHLNEDDLIGCYVTKITVPIMEVENSSNISVWLSSQLRVEDGKAAPDLVKVDIAPTEADFVTVELPKPYLIPSEGVYVGYSFSIDNLSSEEAEFPIAVIDGGQEGSFYLHTSKTLLKWFDVSSTFNASAIIQVDVKGSEVLSYAASPITGKTAYVKYDEPFTLNLNVQNLGAMGVESVEVVVKNNTLAVEETYTLSLEEPIAPVYGAEAEISVEVPAIGETGEYNYTVTVTKVNGEANETPDAMAIQEVVALTSVPTHRAVLEEYTGTWCGWCPRGFVALEKLAELFPDDYVLISYHNGDPMAIMDGEDVPYPSDVQGFPTSFVDRVMEVDPYNGLTEDEPLGIVNVLDERCAEFGVVDVEVAATWNADGTAIDVTTQVTTPTDLAGSNYAIEYVLVADGLTGTTKDWAQSNYFSNSSAFAWDENLSEFVNAGSTVTGLVFNDVAVYNSGIGGIGDILPEMMSAGESAEHNFTINLADAVNLNGEEIIQDKNQLRVVALLIDVTTGEIVNANKVDVGVYDAIVGVDSDSERLVSKVESFDVAGRKVSNAQRGTLVRRITFADGTQKVVKVLVK